MSEKRPAWTHTLRMYLADDVFDDPSYESPAHDALLDSIEAAVGEVLCSTYGHEIVDDQCMIAAHRYCAYCGRLEVSLHDG